MATQKIKLFCILDGDYSSFPLNLAFDDTIGDLKNAIKERKPNILERIDADDLLLWQVAVPDEGAQVNLSKVEAPTPLIIGSAEISEVFGTAPAKRTIHVIVQLPSPVPATLTSSSTIGHSPSAPISRSPSPSQDLEAKIEKITRHFFEQDSEVAVFLKKYVKGTLTLPTTTEGIIGLPIAWRRKEVLTSESRPSFLFLDLPKPPSNNTISNEFKSNVIIDALEKTNAQDVPVFGVSGCGKTRSVIEMLCLQWGFYFNAAEKDHGSNDLYFLAERIEERSSKAKMLGNIDLKGNTVYAKEMTELLFLSRILILKHCLSLPNCRDTFSSMSWTILQTCPTMFMDVFLPLFDILAEKIPPQSVDGLALLTVVENEFTSLRKHLLSLNYPNFTNKTKLRVVIDEAQVLGDRGDGLFLSSFGDEPRPMLSPILHGFRDPGKRSELTVIYCGTGLSIQTLSWALSSGHGVKSYGLPMFPHLEFIGWQSEDSIRSFIDRIKNQLPDEAWKNRIDMLLPPKAINMLYKRLTGRFRPIVTAIEGIISANDLTKWESHITNTEAMLSSWEDKERRGNMIGELLRTTNKMKMHPGQFQSIPSIEDTLRLFLFRWYLLGETTIILKDAAELVEAALGRIKMFIGNARVVMDEPLVLRAVKNYFKQNDPLFIANAEQIMITSTNPTVHGNNWETMMPPVFIETFKKMPFSKWPLPKNHAIPDELKGDVSIVGYRGDEQLVISHSSVTTLDFMKAHAKNNSMYGDSIMPPFYFPDTYYSGPDIIFFVQINNSDVVIPVFVQLKLRQDLSKSDAERALETTSAVTVEKKIRNEQSRQKYKIEGKKAMNTKVQPDHSDLNTINATSSILHDLCPSGTYISMVITYPAKVFQIQAMRPDPEPELDDNLKRIIINIDEGNFPKIFPERHVDFLNKLKKLKREPENDLKENNRKKQVSGKYLPAIHEINS